MDSRAETQETHHLLDLAAAVLVLLKMVMMVHLVTVERESN